MNFNLDKVKLLANGSRWDRFLNHPMRYVKAMLVKQLGNYTGTANVATFWGAEIQVQLPSSLDIYLTGAKTHPSEIRLSELLIQHAVDCKGFLDIGAHIGYFSLLMSDLTNNQLPIVALEASATTFHCLQYNLHKHSNIQLFNLAASNENGRLRFLQLPAKYAEYNSLNVDQYKDEAWFQKLNPSICEVAAIRIDDFLAQQTHNFIPNIVKIDVEGAELSVLQSMKEFIQQHHPMLIVEFVCKKENQTAFIEIENLLYSLSLKPHRITDKGALLLIETDIYSWMQNAQLDSENIVFLSN